MKFELEEYHRNISDEELIADLKRVAAQLRKKSVTQAEYNKYGKFHGSTLRRKMGSWFDVLAKAELEGENRGENRDSDRLLRTARNGR